jgi:hypothetical protein
MGANASTRYNKDIRTDMRKSAIATQLDKIRNLLTRSTALVKSEDADAIVKITTVAETQLARDTKPFTKSDLIAILVKIRTLKGELKTPAAVMHMIDECNKYTVGELNGIVRCAVFDFDTGNNQCLAITEGNTTNLLAIQM